MTPAVRRLLREHGLTVGQIVGTGGGGRITREDVGSYVESARIGKPVNGQVAVGRADVRPAPALTAAPATALPPPTPAPAPAAAGAAPGPAVQVPRTAASARGIAGQQVAFPDGADEVLVPMTQMRRGIASQMTKALLVPHAYVQVEVDATRLVRLRDQQKRFRTY